MTKTEVCGALEWAAATIEESGLLAFVRGYGDVQARCNQDAKLLRTLKARIEAGTVRTNAMGVEIAPLLIIDWSPEGPDGGEAG